MSLLACLSFTVKMLLPPPASLILFVDGWIRDMDLLLSNKGNIPERHVLVCTSKCHGCQ